jgi:hypothetical protein
MATVDLALNYSKIGFDVFPCKERDKTPLVRWAEAATKEENMITGWWEHNPSANVSIATGRRSGVVVLDVDKDHDGYESLQELQERYGKMPDTPVVRTGNGGEHIYFLHPGIEIRNSTGKLGKGLDIRGDGGYVVAPPSIHPNGTRYEWVVLPTKTPFAPMPEWMIELLQEPEKITEHILSEGGIIAGERNNWLTKLAGSMRRKGFDEDDIFSALKGYNQKRCSPPLSDGEVLQIARSVTRYEPQEQPKVIKPLPDAWDVIENLESDIREREKNPVDVWGIHYAWPFISLVTGGKQLGELTIIAGEPGVGKSFFAHQDFLYSAIGMNKIPSTPSLIWCGEMKRKQVFRRFFDMLGVPKRHMLTGNMSQTDWDFFTEAKALIVNSPIYVSDNPLDLKDVRALLEREQAEHGIEQALFDYDWLINAPGKDEIATSQNISRELKQVAHELNISITLISSVNKQGMDTTSENIGNVSGSGKKLHDADIVFMLTKFNSSKNADMTIPTKDYDRIVTLHIKKGRELDYRVPNNAINYRRETPRPTFEEMRKVDNSIPEWMKRKDIA